LAIATAKIQPEHDPDDPRYAMQGHVGKVTLAMSAGGEGAISYEVSGTKATTRARSITADPLELGDDVCIERIENGVAYVERWTLVEQRL
jgi:hypothetical protein